MSSRDRAAVAGALAMTLAMGGLLVWLVNTAGELWRIAPDDAWLFAA